jgi:hypothetical protein
VLVTLTPDSVKTLVLLPKYVPLLTTACAAAVDRELMVATTVASEFVVSRLPSTAAALRQERTSAVRRSIFFLT